MTPTYAVLSVRPRADQKGEPGERLAIEREDDPDGLWRLSLERTLPERVTLPSANRIKTLETVVMTPDEIVWLCEVVVRHSAAAQDAAVTASLTHRQLRLRHGALTSELAETSHPVLHRSVALDIAAVQRRLDELSAIERELAVRNSAATARDDRVVSRVAELERALGDCLDAITQYPELYEQPGFARIEDILARRRPSPDTMVVDDPDAVTVDGRAPSASPKPAVRRG